METMTLGEFKRYCDSKHFRRVTFGYDNQNWKAVDNPLRFQLSFRQIMVSSAPDVGGIFLGEGDNLVYMQYVRHVVVDENRTPLGTVVDVVCTNSQSKNSSIHYTLLMR